MPGYPFDAKFLSQREIRQDFAGRFVFCPDGAICCAWHILPVLAGYTV
jgi:hypothetical protein